MSLEIPGDYSQVVQRLIAQGRFRDEREVIAEGLRLVVLREELYRDVQAGLDELDSGQRLDSNAVYAEARRRIAVIEDQEAS